MTRPDSKSMLCWKSWLSALCVSFGMTGCADFLKPTIPENSYRLACGQQCLKNGENCSRFFALKNEERRIGFEQAKANYWLCMRRYSDQRSTSPVPCVAPGPLPEAFDHCGSELEQCLSACPVTLDELPGLHGAGRQSVGLTNPAQPPQGPSGTPVPSDGPIPFK